MASRASPGVSGSGSGSGAGEATAAATTATKRRARESFIASLVDDGSGFGQTLNTFRASASGFYTPPVLPRYALHLSLSPGKKKGFGNNTFSLYGSYLKSSLLFFTVVV